MKNNFLWPQSLLRLILALVAASLLALAAGFWAGWAWAKALWPLPDGPLSFAFMAAILAGSAAPLLWIALAGELGGLAPYGFSFALMDAGMMVCAEYLYARDGQPAMRTFAMVHGACALVCLLLALRYRTVALRAAAPTPASVRSAMLVEVGVLSLVGWLLVFQLPNVLPWPLQPETSVLYGCVFLGLALYYLYPVVKPSWGNAIGPLIGFLFYDLVLVGPLLTKWPTVRPEHLAGMITALVIIAFSALLAVRYLVFGRLNRTRQGHAG